MPCPPWITTVAELPWDSVLRELRPATGPLAAALLAAALLALLGEGLLELARAVIYRQERRKARHIAVMRELIGDWRDRP
jgi:hypothetical protein